MVAIKVRADSVSSHVSIVTLVALDNGQSTVELILVFPESAPVAVGSIAALLIALVSPSPLAQMLAVKEIIEEINEW